jgi:hypothetical protein
VLISPPVVVLGQWFWGEPGERGLIFDFSKKGGGEI